MSLNKKYLTNFISFLVEKKREGEWVARGVDAGGREKCRVVKRELCPAHPRLHGSITRGRGASTPKYAASLFPCLLVRNLRRE
ncbi:hypothetical protein [Sulfuracidifex tepidarius]|uniref:hypothetical protein n=1 Tax=Sulfuracidifex tepidarius TaxID=1294262 RepID=UPI000B332704|nr:hypothetical protein [Sulfuracidifex tepidarius]